MTILVELSVGIPQVKFICCTLLWCHQASSGLLDLMYMITVKLCFSSKLRLSSVFVLLSRLMYIMNQLSHVLTIPVIPKGMRLTTSGGRLAKFWKGQECGSSDMHLIIQHFDQGRLGFCKTLVANLLQDQP
jgi:hypothetical protein